MLSNDRKEILLMNPVRVNFDLKKHKAEPGEQFGKMSFGSFDSGSMAVPSANSVRGTGDLNVWDGVPFTIQREYRNPVWRKVAEIYIKFRLLFSKPKKNPIEFFNELKDNFEELQSEEIDEQKLTNLLNFLEQSKQKIARSGMMSAKAITEFENKLVEAGFLQYQTEESIIKFIKGSKKGLCLNEIEDFDRIIPDDVMEKFSKAEELKCFDNYYILHFDPKKVENIHYTTEQKKDPILFGVIRGSKKLYFIADWIDELCDLTYADILKKSKNYKLEKTKE